MYEVKIINGADEKIINAVSTNINAPRISGQCKFGINSIDSFSFSIFPSNHGFNSIYNLRTLVEILNTKTNKIIFKGRVLLSTPSMDKDGVLKKTVICESEIGYLMDSIQPYGEYHNITVKGFFELLINNHNSQVSADKKFVVGNVNVEDSNDSLYRFLNYEKTFEAIKDKLIDRLGGELRVRYENNARYLDFVKAIGVKSDVEIRISKNLVTLEQERDPSSIITRLIPLGAKIDDSEERVTISSVNNGKIYIDDEEAISEFGIIANTEIWDNVTRPNTLISKGKRFLSENNKIRKKHNITALDLSVINMDIDSFEVGNTYRLINPLMNIDEYLRVVEKTIDIDSPYDSTLTIGDKFEDIKEYQLKSLKNEKSITRVQETVSATVKVVGNVNSTLNTTIDSLNDTIKILNSTNTNVSDINKALETNINATKEVASKVASLEPIVSSNAERIEKIKKRILLGVW